MMSLGMCVVLASYNSFAGGIDVWPGEERGAFLVMIVECLGAH